MSQEIKRKPESAMFNPDYVKTLPVAPRLFRMEDIVDTDDMPKPAGVWVEQPGILGKQEVSPGILLPSTGRVVLVFQLKRGGGGHINVRFHHNETKWVAEYHFRANPNIGG